MNASTDSVDSVKDAESETLELGVSDAVVVEFREKLDVRNPGDVDAGSRFVVVVFSPLVFVIGGVLMMDAVSLPELEVVSLPELVLGTEDVTFGELELGAEGVSLGVEEASLGASSPETSLRTPDTTETGTPVATLAISDIGSET